MVSTQDRVSIFYVQNLQIALIIVLGLTVAREAKVIVNSAKRSMLPGKFENGKNAV